MVTPCIICGKDKDTYLVKGGIEVVLDKKVHKKECFDVMALNFQGIC